MGFNIYDMEKFVEAAAWPSELENMKLIHARYSHLNVNHWISTNGKT